MNCKQGRFGAQMRWIERSLEALQEPKTCNVDAYGQQRKIALTAKMKELDFLISKLGEAKQNVQTASDRAWLEGVATSLKERVSATLNPLLIN